MSVVFKVIDEKYADNFITGKSIRLGTLYDFRDIEKHSKGISDPNEGVAKSYISETNNLESYEKALVRQDFKNLGLFSGPDVDLHFTNCNIIQNYPNCFIFCSCMEMPDIKSFNGTIAYESGYNAVLRINDIRALSEMLAVALQRAGKSDGGYFGAPVSYLDSEWDYLEKGIKPPNPFEKHIAFQGQDEHRVIFNSYSNDINASIADFEPFPANLVERVN